MSFLPIVQRELRVTARRPIAHWSRGAVAGLAGLLTFQILFSYGGFGDPSRGGQFAYQLLLGIGFIVACGAAFCNADSLSVERREGTLGLLFLTDLQGHDVVLGKLVAGGLVLFFVLLGLAPALALPLLAGGVTLGEVCRGTLMLLNLLLVSLAAGLWTSTRNEVQHRSLRQAGLLLLLLMATPWLVGKLSSGVPPLGAWIEALNPANLAASSEDAYRRSPARFWYSLLAVQIEFWALLMATIWHTSRNWRMAERNPADPTEPPLLKPPRRFADAAPVRWRAAQLPGQRSLLWMAAVLSVTNALPYLFLVFSAGRAGANFMGLYQGMTMAMSFGSGALFAWAAGRFFMEGRRSGEIELLATTPVGAQDMVAGQWQALWRNLRWPMLFMVLLGALPQTIYFLTFQMRFSLGRGIFSTLTFLQPLASAANTILSVLALCWVGMWFAARARRTLAATLLTVGLVKGLPWVFSAVFNLVLAVTGRIYSPVNAGQLPWTYIVHQLALPLLFLVFNLFLMHWAHRNLEQQLKRGALFDPGSGMKGEPFSPVGWLRRLRQGTPA